MRGIEAICIDDKNKPKEIPNEKWIKEGDKYHITRVYVMINQGLIQGCQLAERDISMYEPYNCFRLTRFAIRKEDVEALIQLIKECDELNQLSDFDIKKWVEEVPIKETV